MIKEIPDDWRPDKCGFLIDINTEAPPSFYVISFRDPMDLEREDFAQVVGGWIVSGGVVYLSTLNGPGFLRSELRIDETLKQAVSDRNLDGVYEAIRGEFKYIRDHHRWEEDENIPYSSLA